MSIPLTPKTGGVCITVQALQPADIIVSTTAHAGSKFIRYGSGSAVSHSMVYSGSGNVIEAVPPMVRECSLTDALSGATLAVAYRRVGMTSGHAAVVINFARRQARARARYDDFGAIASGGPTSNPAVCVIVLGAVGCAISATGQFSSPTKFYCSELVFEAFEMAGLPIISGRPDTSYPGQIPQAYVSGILQYVGHLTTSP